MSEPKIIHPDCQGHVSLAWGVVYCRKTQSVYVNASMVRTGKPRFGPLEPDDTWTLHHILRDVFGRYARVRMRSAVLCDPWTELPGMRMNGLDPDEPGAFYAKEGGE